MFQTIKSLLPPGVLTFLRNNFSKYGWFGNYSNWDLAARESSGYDKQEIVQKVRSSLLKVKNGEVSFERDSVLFDEVQYSWPLLSALLWIAAKHQGKLNVIDFGGSLGSSFFQNRKFLQALPEVKWNIVEQSNFVEIGQKDFESEQLKFYHSIDECMKDGQPNCILFSSVIQYLPDPFKFLEEVVKKKIENIIFDRTPFITGDTDRITIQKVNPRIYAASYPCRFFSETKFKKIFEKEYILVESFDSLDVANFNAQFKGLLYTRKPA